MKNLNKYFFIISLILFLNSCNSFSDFKKTMSGEKIANTDEFLIKKKDPLILPPNYEKLPLPNNKNRKVNKSSVESALGSRNSNESISNAKSDLENIILKELQRNR